MAARVFCKITGDYLEGDVPVQEVIDRAYELLFARWEL